MSWSRSCRCVSSLIRSGAESRKAKTLTLFKYSFFDRQLSRLELSSRVHVRSCSGTPTVQSVQDSEKASSSSSKVGEGDDVLEDGEIPPEVAELFDTLRGEALRRLDEFGPIHLFSLCWAYSTARLLDDDLQKQVTDAALRLGKARDAEGFSSKAKKRRERGRDGNTRDKNSSDALVSKEVEGHPQPQLSASGGENNAEALPASPASLHEINDQPRVLAESSHWMVLYKPPFWVVTVDSKEAMKQAAATPFDDEDEGDVDDDGSPERNRKKPRLHMWIRQNLAQMYPVCTDPIEAFGLLHRLDAQTSGLLVCAKTYVGAYWLRLQWCSYTVDKEYVCLVHGKVDPTVREIHKRIRIDKRKAENSRKTISTHCTISPSGKPSYTELVTLAHLVRPAAAPELIGAEDHPEGSHSDDEYYSLVALKLHTGRTHQIRVHMLSIGHPLVCDSKYAEDRFPADRKWCTRNFLHTYRVGFEDVPGDVKEDGNKANVNVFCPLPQDLRDALSKLKPIDESSRRYCEGWLAGEATKLREWDTYAEEIFGADAAKT